MCATLKEDKGIRFHELLAKFSVNVNQCNKSENASNILLLKQDSDSPVLPLEQYMCVGTALRRKAFFESVQAGDVIFGKVCNIFDKVLNVYLVSVLCGPNRWVEDLKILAVGNIDNVFKNDNDNELEIGDNIKAVITNVKKTSEEITISLNDKCLSDIAFNHFPLGRVENNIYYRKSQLNKSNKEQVEEYEPRRYLDHLRKSSSFIDPHGVDKLLDQFHVDRSKSFLRSQMCNCPKETVDSLRERQSYKWSMDMVGTGVKHFRENEVKEARDSFDQAIAFYPNNVEAYVARGALKANSNQLKEAIQDFKKALDIKPNHKNGKKYLIETLFSLSKGYERDSKWKEACRCYKDILEKDSGNTDAMDHLKHVQHLLSREVSLVYPLFKIHYT